MVSDILAEALEGIKDYDLAFYGDGERALIDALTQHMQTVLRYLDTPPMTARTKHELTLENEPRK